MNDIFRDNINIIVDFFFLLPEPRTYTKVSEYINTSEVIVFDLYYILIPSTSPDFIIHYMKQSKVEFR